MADDNDGSPWWVDGYHLLRSYDPEAKICTVWCGAMDVTIDSAFSRTRPERPCLRCTGPAMSAEVRRAEIARAREILRTTARPTMPDFGPWQSAQS